MANARKIISKGDYSYVSIPDHPHATKRGYVLEHPSGNGRSSWSVSY